MTLDISPELQLPLEAITETFGILAKRRTGKSNAAVVMAEQMFDNGLPWVAIDPKGDWWGIRAAGQDGQEPGLAVLVFGGEHGDVPLEPGSGRLVAALIVEKRLTCVLDVSQMTKADQRRFLTDFADHLYRQNRAPLHVFCEEADQYIPQRVMGEAARLVGAFETLVKLGGFRGIGITLITQRSASLNKDVLTQIETLIVLRTPSPQDRKAILGWVENHDAGKDAVADLPDLGNGQAWVFSPQWLGKLVKVQFRRRRTFDSGATPTMDAVAAPPARLADVDLAGITEAMAAVVERAKQDDPRELRKQVARLTRELDAARANQQPETVEVRVEVPVLGDRERDTLLAVVEQLHGMISRLAEVVTGVTAATPPPNPVVPPTTPRKPAAPARVRRVGTRHAAPANSQPGHLRTGAQRMVQTLADMYPMRLTRAQWGAIVHLKTSGGTWGTYMSDIRRLGLIDETGGQYSLTDAGWDYLCQHPSKTVSAADLQALFRDILRTGAAAMMTELISVHPDWMSRQQLADSVGIEVTGGTFGTYLSDLIRNGLATKLPGGNLIATDLIVNGPALQEKDTTNAAV